MNFRKAKKKMKKKWQIGGRWPGNIPPKLFDKVCTEINEEFLAVIDNYILYGGPDKSNIKPIGTSIIGGVQDAAY